ncbi:unnamed protein product [Mucor hiemalis]
MNTQSASPTPTRKRTHLKTSQVATLQESFNSNPLPDSSVRSRLARELSVTERTIQIWFQNRRAKARKLDSLGPLPTNTLQSNGCSNKSSVRAGWIEPDLRNPTPPRYQATFRTMMTPERFEELKHQDGTQIRRRPRSSSKPEPKSSHLLAAATNNSRAMSEGIHQQYKNPVPFSANNGDTTLAHAPSISSSLSQINTAQTPIQMVPLPVSVLRIGSWTRFAHALPYTNQRDWDLVCYGSPVDRELIWRVQAEGHHFRIQVGFDNIHQLRLSQQVQIETGEIVGQLDVELGLPLVFSMWRFGQDDQWIRCGDFTEDKQASIDSLHILQGNHDAFKQALLDLIALAPELATKISVSPTNMLVSAADLTQPPPPLDLCRDFTISPSATPEPSSLIAAAAAAAAMNGPQHMMYPSNIPYGMINPQHLSKANMSHLMLQAPFFYPSSNGNTDNSTNNHNGNEDVYQMQQMMLQQQQQQQQHMMYMNSTHASSSNTAPSSLLV